MNDIRTNNSMKGHIDLYVVSRGAYIEREGFCNFNQETREVDEIFAHMSKGGMSVRIFVNANGKMEIEPYGYGGL